MPWAYIWTKDKFDGPIIRERKGLYLGRKTLQFAIC